ncbi:MAG: nickel-dependent lactate racemase family protein [Candidatus Geothermincolia bacterium]
MRCEWGFGRGTLAFEVPDEAHAGTLNTAAATPLPDLGAALQEAMRLPLGAAPLRESVRPGERVAVLVPDFHRSWARVARWLPSVIRELNAAGVAHRDITVIIATGTHLPPTYSQQRSIVGELPHEVRVVAHDGRREGLCSYLGHSAAGTPIWLNREALAADALVLTGAIVPHAFAGFGGGRKAVVPGIAGIKTVQANHARALAAAGGIHDGAQPGILDGNPVHEDMLDIARRVKPRFLLNVVLNETGEFLGVFAGGLETAHRRGCEFVSRLFRVPVAKADVVIAGRGGYPMDLTFYQAFQAGANGAAAVGEGGSLVLVGACSEGLGPYEFARFFDFAGPEAIEAELRRNFTVPGFVVYRAALLARSVERLYLVSQMPPGTVERIGIIPKRTIQEALEAELAINPRARVLLMPHASQTIPVAP